MPKPLVIVESPAKAKTIASFLGADYDVRASVGHVADLPSKGLAVDVDNHFKPTYELTERGAKVVKEFAPAIELKGDASKGKVLFKTHCAACHQFLGEGNDVGPNLVAALPNKSAEDLLTSLFDPNREVDPRYVNYQALTADGRQLTGIVAVETPTSVTLKRADGATDTVLRANLDSLRSTKLSLMPEGLEKQLKHQDVADLFAYLRSAISGK